MNASAQATSAPTPKNRLKSRLVLLALVLLFSLPIVLSFVWKPTGFVNNGELIEPALALTPASLKTIQGETFNTAEFNEKWTLLIAHPSACDETCEKNLYHMRQVRVGQGKHMGRVRYAWLLNDNVNAEPDASLLVEHPAMTVLQNGVDSVQGFVQQTSLTTEELDSILLIDPVGHLIMRFPPELDPGKVLKDLKRLLKVSPLGEK